MSELSTFGPYTVYECVGSGGMATVHRATIHVGDVEREVALKRLLPHLAEEERFVDDFVREAKLAAHLRHPNIVRLFELGRIGQTYFIAMELVRGATVNTLLRKSTSADKRPSLGAVFSLMLELTDALDHAHHGVDQNGQPLHLVHRDLTPSNLLVTEDGHLKIIDFGVAKAMTGDLVTNSGFAKGKIGYMSPEALAVEAVDARTDIFSAGVVMWELLTGKRLFQPVHDWDRSIHDRKIEPPSSINRECTADVDELVMHALAKSPSDRWQSAEAFHHALATAARPFAGAATPMAVVRWQRTLRVESNFEPYVSIVLEEQSASQARARSQSSSSAPSKSSRNVVPRASSPRAPSPRAPSPPPPQTQTKSASTRTPSPHVVPRRVDATKPERNLATKAETSRSWPPEPTTTPKIDIALDPDPEMELVPDMLIVSDFDLDNVEITGDETIDTEGTKRLSTKERMATLEDEPVVRSRPTRRGLEPPGPTRKRTLDTEPTTTVNADETTPFERDPLDTGQTPVVASDRPPRKPR